MKKGKEIDDFQRGMFVALATLQGLHGQSSVIADALHELGLADADCSSLSDWDKKQLRVIQRAERLGGRALSLRGLRKK